MFVETQPIQIPSHSDISCKNNYKINKQIKENKKGKKLENKKERSSVFLTHDLDFLLLHHHHQFSLFLRENNKTKKRKRKKKREENPNHTSPFILLPFLSPLSLSNRIRYSWTSFLVHGSFSCFQFDPRFQFENRV